MTRQCCICGKEFEPKRKDSVTCSDADCRKAHYKEVSALWKQAHYDRVLAQNRKWASKARQKQKAEKEARIARQDFVADGYAERQIARTLAIAGKVQI